jgi:hypothetical protein
MTTPSDFDMEDKLDFKSLQTRINEIKEGGEESADFTMEYIQCLFDRHDLKESIPDDYELPDVPDVIFDAIRKGEVPTRDQILLMDADTQNHLLFELVWACGMLAVSYYTQDEETEDEEPSTFDVILNMVKEGPGQWSACYLIAVMTLMIARVPSQTMIARLTNNFDESEEQVQENINNFIELASALLLRHKEDKIYYDSEDD